MKFITIFYLTTALLTINSRSFSQSKAAVRFDGLYQTVSDIDTATNDTTYYFLRFYPDGKVLSVTSDGSVHFVKEWFNLNQDSPSIGYYEITANRIYFTTTRKEGTVVYDGQISDKYYLDLSVKSLINGHLSKEKYYFVKIPGLK